MAEENTQNDDAAKKKLPKKMLIVMGIVMVVEGALFGGGYLLFGPEPPSVSAQGLTPDSQAADQELVEVMLIGDNFQNTRQGAQSYLYDATIYVVVQQRNKGHIEEQIELNMARISQDVAEVFARAEPTVLSEPNRLTLKRQILAICQERFGENADHEPYVHDVVISNWVRHNTDF